MSFFYLIGDQKTMLTYDHAVGVVQEVVADVPSENLETAAEVHTSADPDRS